MSYGLIWNSLFFVKQLRHLNSVLFCAAVVGSALSDEGPGLKGCIMLFLLTSWEPMFLNMPFVMFLLENCSLGPSSSSCLVWSNKSKRIASMPKKKKRISLLWEKHLVMGKKKAPPYYVKSISLSEKTSYCSEKHLVTRRKAWLLWNVVTGHFPRSISTN